jgi:hypothetical protein
MPALMHMDSNFVIFRQAGGIKDTVSAFACQFFEDLSGEPRSYSV